MLPEILANWVVGVGRTDISEVEGALVLSVVLDEARRDDVEVVDDVGEGGRDVDVPIGRTVAYNETLKVVALSLLVNVDKLVVLVDLPSEVGDVDTSVALTGDIERVVKELGEAAVEILHGSKGVLGLSHIIVNSVLRVHTDGVSNTSRALDIKNVSTLVPWLRIGFDEVFAIIDDEGAVLLEKCEER